MKGAQCGILNAPQNESYSISGYQSLRSERLSEAANYAQECYSESGSGLLDCNKFVVKNLAGKITQRNSSCPFPGNVCRSNKTNLLLDTGYLDSNDDLGLSTPQSQRFKWRYVLQCAPILTDGYAVQFSDNNRSMERYNYGGWGLSNDTSIANLTYEIEDLAHQYYMLEGKNWIPGGNFRLRQVYDVFSFRSASA